MNLLLTPEQVASVQPMLDEANKPLSQLVIIAQVLRIPYDGRLQLALKLIPRDVAKKVRDLIGDSE